MFVQFRSSKHSGLQNYISIKDVTTFNKKSNVFGICYSLPSEVKFKDEV